ncbi:MAG: tryptophan--tRNA ligase [Myxococcales bacterium]|nr:tryptophan--tRNA ligase [Myxococcales bacterium]
MTRLFSGIQPSGELHIGNFLGAIHNWVELQNTYEAIYCVVDLHALSGDFDPAILSERTLTMARHLLACGIDPDKSVLFVQGHVPEHAELMWIFCSVTPIGELERMTQFKDKSARQLSINTGLLIYPVLQAADILLYKGEVVPVGEDQVQHLELTREIARKFNTRFGPTFPEPASRLSTAKRIVGLDGQAKMSKSLGNTIGIIESPESMWDKLRPAFTDPARQRKSDPGEPTRCNIFTLHGYFTPAENQNEIASACRGATIGCFDCKKILHKNMSDRFEPIRQREAELQSKPGYVVDVLEAGASAARSIARQTVGEVREKMGMLPCQTAGGD